MQNPSLGAICDRVVGLADRDRPSAILSSLGAHFRKLEWTEGQPDREGWTEGTDDGGAARGRESEGAILLPAHFTTLDTAKFAIRRTSLRGSFVKMV